MEDLFSAIVMIVGGIIAVVASAQKKQKEKQQRTAAWPGVETARPQQAAPPAPTVPAASMLPPRPAAPTVHPHLKPDCATHDVPGSLGVTSLEGKDPCHEDQLSAERSMAVEEALQPGIELAWSGKELVQAFVMQEVLTRPCQRRAR